MKRFYTFLSLFLLSLVGITQAVAQQYEQGDLLTDMNDVVGKEVLVYCPGGVSWDHPSGYMNGTNNVSSQIGAENIYVFEAVDGETADGQQLYRLKQKSTGLYYKDPTVWGTDDDTPVEMTANASEAYKFTSMVFEEQDPNSFQLDDENWRTAATPAKQDLSEIGFVFSRYTRPANTKDWPAVYLGSIGSLFWSPYVDTNVWRIYTLNTLTGVNKLVSYIDYYFSQGPDALAHGKNPGQYAEEAWQEANEAYLAANDLFNGTHTDAEYDAMCERLKQAYEKLQANVIPLAAGYYLIRDSRTPHNYMFSTTSGSDELIGSGNYTQGEELTTDDAKYIWYVTPGDKENIFTIKNYYTESYITGQKNSAGRFNLGKQANIGVAMEGQVETPSFLIYVPQDKESDHSQQLNTSNGYIVSWNSQPGDAGNCFHFETVDQSLIDQLEATVRQQALNDRLQKLYDEASRTKSLNDGSYGLVTDASALSSNATCQSEGSLAGLLDGDNATYFHTEWSASGNDPKAYHYLQADLGRAVNGVKLAYTGRYRGVNNRPGNQPKTINVYVTNDPNGDWNDLGNAVMTYTEPVIFQVNATKKDTVENMAGELSIPFDGNYRYFRFEVLNTVASDTEKGEEKLSDYPFWYLSELRFLSSEAGATNYDMVDASIRSAFEAQLAAAAAALEAGTATAEGIDALQAAYDNLMNNLPDLTRITTLANTAKETAKAAAVGEEPGYYPQAAVDALNAAAAAAEAKAQPGLSVAQVNETVSTLQAAIDAFNNTLILPEAGKYYFVRSASEKANWQTNQGYNSKQAAIYSRDNALTGAVRFTMPNNGYEAEGELTDSINLYNHVKYLWYVEKSGNQKIVLRNVGTGMYLSNHTASNNAQLAQSTEPEELTVGFSKAGAFYIQVGEGIYANAQLGGAMVAWSDHADDNGSIKFEEAAKNMYYDEDYWWTVTPGAWQIITLPVAVKDPSNGGNGTAYTLVGQSDDNKLVLSKLNGTVEAGTPFIFKANDEVLDDNNLPNAYFMTAEGGFADVDGLFTYALTPKSVNGLTGTVAAVDTCYKDRAYFDAAGELRTTGSKGKVAIGNNSGYFNGTHATGVSTEGADALIDLPEGAVINGIADVVVLPEVVDVYSLNGVLVRKNVKSANAVNGLPAGIYVVGGQKVIVK